MTEVRFFAAGEPKPQGSMKAFVPRGWHRPIITSDNKGLKGWRNVVAFEAQRYAPPSLFTGPVEVELGFRMPKPKSYPKMRSKPHTVKPDIDKLIRAVFDAIKNVIWRDDSQVVKVTAWKDYDDRPGVSVLVKDLSNGC